MPFTIALFAASFIVMVAAASAWRKRKVTGGVSLTLMFLAIAIWCFFSAMETTSVNEYQRYLWSAMSYIGLCNVAPLLLVFACQYSDSGWRLHNWVLVLIWSVPVFTLALAFTNGSHHLIWTGVTPGPVAGTNTVIYHHGPWFAFEMLWFLGLSLLASYHLVRVAIRSARLYVLQAMILLVSIVIPWIGLLLFVLPRSPTSGLDTTSLGFAASAVLIMTAIGRLRFLDIVPQARASLMENMQEGFLVLDLRDRIIDINRSACRLCAIGPGAVGKSLSDANPRLGGAVSRTGENETLVLSPGLDAGLSLEVSVSPLVSRVGRQTGRLLLVRDVSERRRAETERERLIADLQDALANVKRLRGLLPICASCKKIRDDQGYWHQVEHYMRDHAEVEFSHGICPQCVAKLYPELAEREEPEQS